MTAKWKKIRLIEKLKSSYFSIKKIDLNKSLRPGRNVWKRLYLKKRKPFSREVYRSDPVYQTQKSDFFYICLSTLKARNEYYTSPTSFRCSIGCNEIEGFIYLCDSAWWWWWWLWWGVFSFKVFSEECIGYTYSYTLFVYWVRR